jgi:probable lipoprotein NlpC
MLRFKKFILLLFIVVVLVACGTRKHVVNPSTTNAAKVANAMAALKSKPLYRFINDWTGVRYLLGGMDKKGIDCSGFAYLLQKDIYGQILPRISKDQANAITNKNLNNLK